jgi:predicted acetyltransferase
MALTMRWVDESDLDRVAETRWKCYGHAGKDLARFKEGIRTDPRASVGDFLLAERDGEAVGTATSLPLTMWVRGAAMRCQGVAYVGTVKSARRRGGKEMGVASAVMWETLRIARQRGDVVTALMPFRVSFYEHFGYGAVERRAEWTIPLSITPAMDCSGWKFMTAGDRAAQAQQWQRSVQGGQCDVEFHAKRWEQINLSAAEEGMEFIDRSGGEARASMVVTREISGGRNILQVQRWSADSAADFGRMLSFLGTMRDQFSAATIQVPMDWHVHRLLREGQVPHRAVDHPASEVRCDARMQVRILDHRKFLESIHWPMGTRGRAVVEVAECEGNISRFSVEVEGGRAKVADAAGKTEFQCPDRVWAAVATGDLAASDAVRWGLAWQTSGTAVEVLDALAAGPRPFCRERF